MATICNVRIFDGTAFRKESAVTFENGTVTALDDRREGEDMGGVLLCPGFVDIHMHGQKGLDSMRPGDNGRMAETQVKYGVTSFCPASITETDEAIRAWIADLHAAGVTVMIVSNNRSGRRVTDFCAELGIPYQGHAKKPGTEGLRKAMARAGKGKSETAMLGDKLLTDVLAAKRAGVLSLMVEPLGGAVGPWQRVLHALQAPVKGLCRENTLRCGKKNR